MVFKLMNFSNELRLIELILLKLSRQPELNCLQLVEEWENYLQVLPSWPNLLAFYSLLHDRIGFER